MKRGFLLAGAALALTSSLALAAPESLLPPGFGTPAPAPAPAPPQTSSPTPRAPSAPAPAPAQPVPAPVLPIPQWNLPDGGAAPPAAPSVGLPEDFPSLAEIEAMSPDEIDELFGLKPKFDVPPEARRATRQIGIIGPAEGGFPIDSLIAQPASLVRAAITATEGPLVSRWGHILLRRGLASRLDAPRGMDPVEFAAIRAALLNRMGEGQAARALVQDVDSANYDKALADAAFDAYLRTGDILGICPVQQLKTTLRDDPEWEMAGSICDAFTGDARQAERELGRALYYGRAPRIDVLLAQRYAGAAGQGRRAVTIEWDKVDTLTPWRVGLATALGVDIPEGLRQQASSYYDRAAVLIPAVPLEQRVAAADRAAREGILSSAAMIDLYSQAWADSGPGSQWFNRADRLRDAYLAADPAARLAAMRDLWGENETYGRKVLTAYAAARLPVNADFADAAPQLIASMLAAGLDRNAIRWAPVLEEGSLGWSLLAVASPTSDGTISRNAFDAFMDQDNSPQKRKSRFLLAGLAGLDRLDTGAAADFSQSLGVNLARESAWSKKIDQAGEMGNAALVALLAGVGMQGESWEQMTGRQLFHIIRALHRAGLDAEARMIAAEAVARG